MQNKKKEMARGEFTFTMNEGEFRKLQQSLNKMSKIDQSTAVQNPLKEGATKIMQAGKSNLSQRNKTKTGNLKKSFGVKVDKKRAAAYAGFRRPTGNHSHLIDRGTVERWTKYNHPIYGRYRGSISRKKPNTGTSFWTDAVSQNGTIVMENLCEAIYAEMNRITNRN